jgi:hypothetical protein
MFASNTFIPLIAPTRADFVGLVAPTSQHLQSNCNRAGINNASLVRTRIGILANDEDDCGSPDSLLGIGNDNPSSSCGQTVTSVGSFGGCGSSATTNMFAFVFVRRNATQATSCADHLAAGHTVSGVYSVDFDGIGSQPPERVFCDMDTTHDGGGWTMVMKFNSGVSSPVPDANALVTSPSGSNAGEPRFMTPLMAGAHYLSEAAATSWNAAMKVASVRAVAYATSGLPVDSQNDQGVAKELVNLHFKGIGTDKTSWFAASNLDTTAKNGPVGTPWTDLQVAPFVGNFFSVLGENVNPNAVRRFFINKNYGGCPADVGWFAIVGDDPGGSVFCPWDGYPAGSGYSNNAAPRIVFANQATAINWQSAKAPQFGIADTFAVFVK